MLIFKQMNKLLDSSRVGESNNTRVERVVFFAGKTCFEVDGSSVAYWTDTGMCFDRFFTDRTQISSLFSARDTAYREKYGKKRVSC